MRSCPTRYMHSSLVSRDLHEDLQPNDAIIFYAQVLEWDNWISADVMEGVEETTVLKKLYFLKQIEGDEGSPDFSSVYCLDPQQRKVLQCKIDDRSEGADDPVMR